MLAAPGAGWVVAKWPPSGPLPAMAMLFTLTPLPVVSTVKERPLLSADAVTLQIGGCGMPGTSYTHCGLGAERKPRPSSTQRVPLAEEQLAPGSHFPLEILNTPGVSCGRVGVAPYAAIGRLPALLPVRSRMTVSPLWSFLRTQ